MPAPDVQILEIGDLPPHDAVRQAKEEFERRSAEIRRQTVPSAVYTPSQTVPSAPPPSQPIPTDPAPSRPTELKLPDPTAVVAPNFCVHCGKSIKGSKALAETEPPASITAYGTTVHIYRCGDVKIIHGGPQSITVSQA